MSAALTVLLAGALQAPVDGAKINEAIDKGIAFLRAQLAGGRLSEQSEELVLWTFVHARIPEDDPDFARLMKRMLERPVLKTYTVSLQAMILEAVDRARYQTRILHCAQFLVDNQFKNGSWGYGERTEFKEPKVAATSGLKKPGPAKAEPYWNRKAEIKKMLAVKRQRQLEGAGDNSNAQYALLGLRACNDAGISLPGDVAKSAEQWWRAAQDPRKEVTGGPGPRGWDYQPIPAPPKGAAPADPPGTGSMTAGGVGSLSICLYLQDKGWTNDKDIKAGLAWLLKQYSVEGNPPNVGRNREEWYYYYMYGLERALILYDPKMAKLGEHDWYSEGARVLLSRQGPDGAFRGHDLRFVGADDAWNTCFAILFLRRSTAPLVIYTGGVGAKAKAPEK